MPFLKWEAGDVSSREMSGRALEGIATGSKVSGTGGLV